MRIYDCENQLTRIMKKYTKLSEINKNISDRIIYINNNLCADDILYIIKQIHRSFDTIPINLYKQIKSYFKFSSDIIDSEIENIKLSIKHFTQLFNTKLIDSNLINQRLSSIENQEDTFSKLNLFLDFISKCLNTSYEFKYIDLVVLYKACIEAKSIIFDYMISLELPTESDYEVGRK